MSNSRRFAECSLSPLLTRKQVLRAALNGASAAALLTVPALFPRIGNARAADKISPDAAGAPQTARAPDKLAQVSEIAPGVFVHHGHIGIYSPSNGGDICNTGFIIGRDAVAVIDTGGTAHLGEALKAKITALTDRPIRYVINTHMHPDHVLGNAPFRAEGTQFVGHHKLGAALAARAERYLSFNKDAVGAAEFAGTEIVLPTLTVTDRLELDLGDRKLVLTARPTAHTDNDLTVRDSHTETEFMGDLIFSIHVPTLDGSIRGWLALLDVLEAQSAQRIVPGHGPASMEWPAAAAPVKRYLTTVANGVRQAIKDGQTMSEAVETVGLDERDRWQMFDEFHRRNVSAAFAELEWE